MDNLLAAAVAAIAFGFPALVARKRPDLYFRLAALFWTLGAFAFTLTSGAFAFYDAGNRAALARLGSDLSPQPLWGIDITVLAKYFVWFCLYTACVWIYGRFATTPTDASSGR